MNLNGGIKVSKDEFINKKNQKHKIQLNPDKIETLKENNFTFDKTNDKMIRYPKGFFAFSQE